MIRFHKSFICKTAAVCLACVLILQFEIMQAQGSDVLADNFAAASSAYLAGDYGAARSALETMLPDLEKVSGRDMLNGETRLLLGATLEKLQEKEAAIVQYCLAKKLLGAGKSVAGIDLGTLQYYSAPCPEAPAPVQAVSVEDPLETQFTSAKQAFFAGNFSQAKTILEKLIAEVNRMEGRDTMKGEIYLLSGATYEKLKYKELSLKYFCLAKEILGQGRTFEGLVLKNFKHYKRDCVKQTGQRQVTKKKGGFGKFLGAILGLAVVGVAIYFLYTKVFKDDSEGEDGPIHYEDDYQAWTCWHASAASSSATLPTFSPANDWAPMPAYGNNYDDDSTLTISGPEIYSWSIRLAVTACQGLTRRDIIYVNDVQVLDVTNKFDRACGGNITDFCNNPVDGMQYDIASGSGEVTIKLRHRIIFTSPANNPVRVLTSSSSQAR